jgi:glycosyltransferase involved in cell wall biosynthesis
MVTLPVPARFEHLKRSLSAYCGQTYAHRELVVVMDRGTDQARDAIGRHVAALNRPDIRLVDPPGTPTLGALRNISWREARGDILCQWDDDDLYHPDRIEQQLAALRRSASLSVCLQEVMQFFPASRRLYQINWSATPLTAKPGSLMCLKSAPIRYPEAGAEASLGEDTAVLLQLQRLGSFHALPGAPHLYVYVSHGQNTYDDAHHHMLADRLAVSRGLLRRGETALRQCLAPFDFGPGEVIVQGHNGPAFTLGARPEG